MSKPANVQRALSAAALPHIARLCAAVRCIDIKSMPATFLRFLHDGHLLAVVDQLVVSGTSFLTIVLIGRSTSPAEVGEYSVAISLLAAFLAVQNALILLPYSIQLHRAGKDASGDAGSSLALSGLMSLVAAGAMGVTACGLAVGGAQPVLSAMSSALAATLPFALMRDFARRFAFASLRVRTALAIDVAVAAIQLASLGYLAWTGALSAVTALAALGLACALPAFVWLRIVRAGFSIRLAQLRGAAMKSWELGKWLILGQLTVQLQSYVGYWLAMVIAGAAVTGIYAACMSIVAFANPVIFGIGNVLTPKLALAWNHGGSAGLRKEALRSALLLGGIMAVFCAVIAFAGDDLLRVLYHGREYAGHGDVVTVLAVAMLATAIGMPASNALASMERPRAIVVVGGFGAAVTVGLIALLMLEWGLPGTAYGLLGGSTVGALGRWLAFLSIARKAHEPASIGELLPTLTGAGPDRTITRLGEGDHAQVYAVSAPNAPRHTALVVKVYRSGSDPGMARAQSDALARLHAALHGRAFNGWTMHVPRPLALSQSPLALTMTSIPGRPLDVYAANGRLAPEVLETASAGFAAAMQTAWQRGLMHGDLGLRNVLFDAEARTLALIDPGTRESCLPCNEKSPASRAAALDLGHMLADLASDVSDLFGNPAVRLHKQSFVAGVLRSVLVSAPARDERDRLLEGIRTSVSLHLASTLTPSWSPRGLWHGLVKAIAERRIADILARLENDFGLASGEKPPQSRAA